VSLEDVRGIPVLERLARAKYADEQKTEQIVGLEDELDKQIDALLTTAA
jgi:hypothetical protein